MTSSRWIDTQGTLEVPILLTNTMNVGCVMDGVVAYMLERQPDIGITDAVVVPTVAKCNDARLDDVRGPRLDPRHGSGDLFLAFSTANRVPHRAQKRSYRICIVADGDLNPIFRAAQEATAEATVDALKIETTTWVATATPPRRFRSIGSSGSSRSTVG